MKSKPEVYLCLNCGSSRHRACCARCGALLRSQARGQFCTMQCARRQAYEDRESYIAERLLEGMSWDEI